MPTLKPHQIERKIAAKKREHNRVRFATIILFTLFVIDIALMVFSVYARHTGFYTSGGPVAAHFVLGIIFFLILAASWAALVFGALPDVEGSLAKLEDAKDEAYDRMVND